MYDKVVGIGYNCEISFRLRNYFGTLDSQLFSWAYIYDREKFIEAFRNPQKIYSQGMTLCSDNMFECNVTGVRFHPRHEVLEDKSRDEQERIEWCESELKQRVEHLKVKHIQLFDSGLNTLFILKVFPTNEAEDICYIKTIYKMISDMYKSGTFTLLIIFPENKLTVGIRYLENRDIKIRSVRWFPPQKHTDIASDSKCWGKILDEFCPGDSKSFYRREWKQRKEIIPGMITNKIKKILRRGR